jgi:very-short-patch-repair endonuclease
VAITRARQEVIVFASLDPEQIDLSRSNATGVHHLRSFLEYAKRGVGALQEKTGYSLATAESPFEQDVGAQLAARGYQVVSQVGYSGYRIDLAVVHPQHADRFLLGIECDGANYHQAKTARDRDSLRQQVLQGLGWRLHRIWSSDWWHDRDGELARVEAAIAAALEAPVTEVMMRPPTPPAIEDKIAELVASPPLQAGAPLTLPGFDLSGYQASQASCEEAGRIDLYSTAAARPARRLISKVIDDEAPMSLALLCQRVASQWGIARITPRLQTRVSRLIGKRAKRVTHGEDIFLWGLDQDPKIYDQFREHGAGDAHRRKPEDLPPEEVANAAYHVLQAQVSLPPSDLVREVGRLFGYQRAGQNVERYVRRGIDLLIEKEWAEMQDDMVVVVMREGG